MADFQSIRDIIATWKPDEIYNLASQSSVARSFELPGETFESISTATCHVQEAVRELSLPAKPALAGQKSSAKGIPEICINSAGP